MNRRTLAVGFASASALASWLLLSQRPVLPKPRPIAVAPNSAHTIDDPVAHDAVEVRYTLVTADVITEAAAEGPSARSAPPKRSRIRAPVAESARHASAEGESDQSFGARAKRAFFGDGRHRPEPFPRVK